MNEDEVTYRFMVITGLLAHRVVSRIIFDAKAIGLSVEHSHDGGRITRRHIITLTGSKEAITVVTRYVERITK